MASSMIHESSGTAEHPRGGSMSETDAEMMKVLRMKMMDLKYIFLAFHNICMYLSIRENLPEFLGECGICMRDEQICDAMIKNQPKTLPAKSFLELYFRDNNTTLREFMRTLLRMEERHPRIPPLVTALWNAALFGNSKYFRKLYNVKL